MKAIVLGVVAVTLFTFPASAEDETVLLQLDEPGTTLHRVGDGRDPPTICTAPCEVRVPRDGAYYVVHHGTKSKPFTITTPSGERVHVDVHVQSVSRAPIGAIILASTFVLVGALEIANIPLRSDHTCDGWYCISPASFSSLIDGLAVVLGVAGSITSLAFFASTKTRVVVDTDGHGAFLGVRGTF